jgi:hypothetical protein
VLPETTVAASLFIDLAAQFDATAIASDALCRQTHVDPAFLTRPHRWCSGPRTARAHRRRHG